MQLLLTVLFVAGSLIPILIILYPFYIAVKCVIFFKPVRKERSFVLPVSIIIACYNEEKFIRRKLDSLLQKEEWIEGSELIVVSNGSTDSTDDILREFESDRRVKLYFLPDRLSKIEAVNLAVTKSKCELLVFSDCRQMMSSGSVRALVSNFSDPNVGTVTATLSSLNHRGSLLRNVLNKLSQMESKCGSSMNVFGALYAQRRAVFRQIPTELLFDDLFALASTLAQRKRVVSEISAKIYDLDFQSYYGRNRLGRLVRGLLIFYSLAGRLIRHMRVEDGIRFFVFKYAKLLLPISLIVLDLAFSIQLAQQDFLLAMIWFLLHGMMWPLRESVFLIRLVFYFQRAMLTYAIGNERSNKWDKLNIRTDLNSVADSTK